MIDISLTRFLDFTLKNGAPKYNSLKQTKAQSTEAYSPAKDYYKKIRDAIVDHHRNGTPFSSVERVASNVDNASKTINYPMIAKGYKTFRGHKHIDWFAPPSSGWVCNGVQVSVNPELGLEYSGKKHVIKLYFKDPKPKKIEVKAIISLMDAELQDSTRSLTMGVLDVRRGRLFADVPPNPGLLTLMEGEAAAIAAMWARV